MWSSWGEKKKYKKNIILNIYWIFKKKKDILNIEIKKYKKNCHMFCDFNLTLLLFINIHVELVSEILQYAI